MFKKECCRNCHFLAKSTRAFNPKGSVFSWTIKDRENGKLDDKDYTAECYRGVWDTGIEPSLNTKLPDLHIPILNHHLLLK